MKQNEYVIYCIKNKINQKMYIGYTSKGIDVRWKQHVSCALNDGCFLLQKAIRKYGATDDVWEKTILVSIVTDDYNLIKEKEKYFIKKFNTNALNGGIGYNMTNGGDGFSGYHHSKETLQRISQKLKGKKRSSEAKENIRKSAIGKKMSNEAKRKTGIATNERFSSEEFRNYHSKQTSNAMRNLPDDTKIKLANRARCIVKMTCEGNILEKYRTVYEAAISLGVTSSMMSSVLNGRVKSSKKNEFGFPYKGFVWRYEET